MSLRKPTLRQVRVMADEAVSESQLPLASLAGMAHTVRRELAERCRPQATVQSQSMSLIEWSQRFLPHYFTKPPSAMHRWLDEQFARLCVERGQKVNCIGPRGGAKSTVGALAWPLRLAVECREPYIWIVSDTKDQAQAHLAHLKAELIENRALREAYGQACERGAVWRGRAVSLRNGVVIEAFGAGQRIRGRRAGRHRPSLIICDDLQNDSHIESARARFLSSQWFHGTLEGAGTRRTNILNLATALHRDAIAFELHRTPSWTSRIFRAIAAWPENTALWLEWESLYRDADDEQRIHTARRFYDDHRADMDAAAELLWPDEEDLYALMRLKAEIGRGAFEREKQSSPIDPLRCEWPESYFDAESWFDDWHDDLVLRVVALDPSKGRDARRGDYSAYVALAMDARGVFYVEADLARRPTPAMVADGVEWVRRFRPDAFGVETNQYQELLAGEFAAEFVRQGLPAIQPWALDNRVSKLVRIRRLGPLLAARRLRFKRRSPSTDLLVRQLIDFPIADHDDGPDALEMAVRLAMELAEAPSADDGLGSRLV